MLAVLYAISEAGYDVFLSIEPDGIGQLSTIPGLEGNSANRKALLTSPCH